MYAVMTGDLVKSSDFLDRRKEVLQFLDDTLAQLGDIPGGGQVLLSHIYRGDSFQIVTDDAKRALRSALFMRARLMQNTGRAPALEARIAMGLGDIEYLDRDDVALSDGEAFRLSGRALEDMPAYRRLIMRVSGEALNGVLDALSVLIDALCARWSREQAEAVSLWIFGATQDAVADRLGVSQSAVQQRLRRAGHFALDVCLRRFEDIVLMY